MQVKIKSGWFLLMAIWWPTGASALPDHATPTMPVVRVILSAPVFTSLGEAEIRSAVSGKALLLDDAPLAPGIALDIVMLGGCPPIEKFGADGSWERGVCARGYTVDRGHWSIKTDGSRSLLCTVEDGQEPDCRAVWRRSSLDRLILTVNARHGEPDYNAYRTEPL